MRQKQRTLQNTKNALQFIYVYYYIQKLAFAIFVYETIILSSNKEFNKNITNVRYVKYIFLNYCIISPKLICLVFHIYDSVKYKGYAGHFTYYTYAKSKKKIYYNGRGWDQGIKLGENNEIYKIPKMLFSFLCILLHTKVSFCNICV